MGYCSECIADNAPIETPNGGQLKFLEQIPFAAINRAPLRLS